MGSRSLLALAHKQPWPVIDDKEREPIAGSQEADLDKSSLSCFLATAPKQPVGDRRAGGGYPYPPRAQSGSLSLTLSHLFYFFHGSKRTLPLVHPPLMPLVMAACPF